MSAIIKKDFKKFFTTPMYFFNMMVFPIMAIVGVVYGIIKFDLVKEYVSMFMPIINDYLGVSNIPFASVIFIIVFLLFSSVYSSAVSLSMEGNKFWILKSLPISTKTIVYSKIITNMILQLVPGLLVSSFILIVLEVKLTVWLMTIILVILTSYATSTFGIIVNLYFPKFEFKNEVEVYKQSIAMMIFMFGLMGLTVGFGLIGYFLITNISNGLIIDLLFLALMVVLSIICYFFIENKSEKLFRKL